MLDKTNPANCRVQAGKVNRSIFFVGHAGQRYRWIEVILPYYFIFRENGMDFPYAHPYIQTCMRHRMS